MPFIISATDFKDASKNSTHYACALARQMKCDVQILHAVSISKKISKTLGNTPEELEDMMEALVKKYKTYYPDVTITSRVITGSIVDGLNNYIKNHEEPSLVVIGNNYNHENPAFMDGNLLEIFRYLNCPVVAVPKEKGFQPIKKVCFAFDNNIEGAKSALKHLADISIALNFELHIIIGSSDGHHRDNLPDIHPEAGKILAHARPIYHFIKKKDLDQGIQDFGRKNHMDWLAVLPRQHSGLGALLHKSHTQFMVNSAHLPIMALHES